MANRKKFASSNPRVGSTNPNTKGDKKKNNSNVGKKITLGDPVPGKPGYYNSMKTSSAKTKTNKGKDAQPPAYNTMSGTTVGKGSNKKIKKAQRRLKRKNRKNWNKPKY